MPVWGKLREPRRALRRAARPAWWPRPTATAGSSRRSIRADPFRAWPAPTSSCSSCAPRATRRSYLDGDGPRATASTASSSTTPRPAPTTPTTATACRSGCSGRWACRTLVIDGDLNDLRCYSEEQARTNIEALRGAAEARAGLGRARGLLLRASTSGPGRPRPPWSTGRGGSRPRAVVARPGPTTARPRRCLGAAGAARGWMRAAPCAAVCGHRATAAQRRAVRAPGSRTEIALPRQGLLSLRTAGPLTVVDIGGQDTKIIRVDAQGRRVGYKMNRKCAAGTGASSRRSRSGWTCRRGARRPGQRLTRGARWAASAPSSAAPRCSASSGRAAAGRPGPGRLPLGGQAGPGDGAGRGDGGRHRRSGGAPPDGGAAPRGRHRGPVTVPAHAQEIGALGVAISALAAARAPAPADGA